MKVATCIAPWLNKLITTIRQVPRANGQVAQTGRVLAHEPAGGILKGRGVGRGVVAVLACLRAEEQELGRREVVVEDGGQVGGVVVPEVARGGERVGDVVRRVPPEGAALVPVVVPVLAADDARVRQSVGARVVLEVVRVRVDLPRDEDVVVLQDLRQDVRVETPFDVAHHVLLRHERLNEIVASGCPLGEGGDVVRYIDRHVFNYLRQRLGEIRQLRRQSGRGHDGGVDDSGLRRHQDRVNNTWRLLARAQEVLARCLGGKDLGQNPGAHLRGFCSCVRSLFNRVIHGDGPSFSG